MGARYLCSSWCDWRSGVHVCVCAEINSVHAGFMNLAMVLYTAAQAALTSGVKARPSPDSRVWSIEAPTLSAKAYAAPARPADGCGQSSRRAGCAKSGACSSIRVLKTPRHWATLHPNSCVMSAPNRQFRPSIHQGCGDCARPTMAVLRHSAWNKSGLGRVMQIGAPFALAPRWPCHKEAHP